MAQNRRWPRPGSRLLQKLLLVEGSDDENVIDSLKNAVGLDFNFDVEPGPTFSGVINRVRGYWQSPGLRALGMIVDADEDFTSQWSAIRESLRSFPVMLDLPDRPEAGGTIIPGGPRLGIWVMPDNGSSGELEDFIYRMIPQPDPIWPMAEKYIDSIPDVHRKFPEHKSLRAKVHAWMATRNRPRPIWSGIEEGDLELESNSEAFLRWLRLLFSDDLP